MRAPAKLAGRLNNAKVCQPRLSRVSYVSLLRSKHPTVLLGSRRPGRGLRRAAAETLCTPRGAGGARGRRCRRPDASLCFTTGDVAVSLKWKPTLGQKTKETLDEEPTS